MDTEFVRKYKALRANREPDELGPDGGGPRLGNGVLRVGENFNLGNFLRGNKIEGLLSREKKGKRPSPPHNTGIHGFHK